jgi:hypothetical protein
MPMPALLRQCEALIMHLLLIGLESIALVVGSLAAAIMLCSLLWCLFRLLRHPAWAALAILVLVALACTGHLPASPFLQMMLAFAAIGAIPLWAEGRAWRRPTGANAPRRHSAEPAPAHVIPKRPGFSRYPAIVACIGEDRRAERAEVRMVAQRIWRETYEPQGARSNATPSFALRRRILRAAKYATSGQNSG